MQQDEISDIKVNIYESQKLRVCCIYENDKKKRQKYEYTNTNERGNIGNF